MATLEGHGAPLWNTVAEVGDRYTDLDTNRTYKCTAIYTTSAVKPNLSKVIYDWQQVITESGSGTGGTVEVTRESIREALGYIPPDNQRSATIELPISGWVGSEMLYSQTVNVPIVTENSQVELRPSPVQLQELLTSEISLTAANESGIVTVFSIGGKPISDYTMQIIVSEVTI